MAELSKFSEEMMVQIMSRLPPKSLMRFKSVHKSWYTLIINPNFAAKHLSVSKHNKLSSTTTILFKRYVLRDTDTDKREMVLSLFNYLSHDHNDDGDHHLPTVMEDLDVPSSMGLKRRNGFYGIEAVEITGHCDGIICLSDYRKHVVLCNPSIKQFKLLPVSSLLLSSPNFTRDSCPAAAVGFGYDLKSKTYKVVRILHYGREFYDNDERVVINPPRAEVYSVDTNSWKEIKTDNLVNKTNIVWPDYWPEAAVSIYCKGILYWCATEKVKECSSSYTDDDEDQVVYEITERIILYDIVDETFRVISSPGGYSFSRKVFGLWNDQSVAFCSRRSWEEGSIDIWVLEDTGAGVEGCWTKYLTFQPAVNILFPLTLVGKREQYLLVAIDECAAVFYDFCAEKYMYLLISGVSLENYQAVFYVNSIISVRDQ